MPMLPASRNARVRRPAPTPAPRRPMVGPHSAAAMNARARKPVPVTMGASRGRAPVKKATLDYIMGGANPAGKKMTKTGANAGGGLMSRIGKMSGKSKMGIGLGLGVAAAVTMNRRGEGASSGRQSIYRF